ncbi:MAG: discoidin domain-containing protein [Lachnospiraceae bacterium]|nr:discoidin domain-containing protein [Lachnospiraceae bacterium]
MRKVMNVTTALAVMGAMAISSVSFLGNSVPVNAAGNQLSAQNVSLGAYFSCVDAKSSSTTGAGSEVSANLFDGNVNTKMYTGNYTPIRVAWEMKQPVIVKNYTLTTANDSATYSFRNPVDWQLFGSNDGTTWTQIDRVTNGGIGAVNYTGYTYETDKQEAFQFYQLQVEKTGGYGGFQLSEVSMFGDVVAPAADIGASLMDSFEAFDSAASTVTGYSNELTANIFDGNTATKVFSSKTGTICWSMKDPVYMYSYTLTTANDNAIYHNRNPKNWVLYGSNNGSNWSVIDTVNNSGMGDVNYTPYTFAVDQPGKYKHYKLDISENYGNSFQLSELSFAGVAVSKSEYDILFTGDWDLVTSTGYVNELVKLFYNSYPRLYARWGDGSEPKTISFKADKNYDGVAYCQGTTVCVSTNYANSHPNDIGFFSHEITHSVQQYNNRLNYGDDVAWWTENMANYGGFRYFHWSNPKYVQIYEASDPSLQDWGYENYGNNKWFFAYMDAKYPTTRDNSGNIHLGLIDALNHLIKTNNTGSAYTDDPYNTSTPFNHVVRDITGYDCIESLRLHYVSELQNGTWTFTGFGNYTDNWITENIEGVPNPTYPMLGERIHGNITNPKLANPVTTGNNLLQNKTIAGYSGQINANEAVTKLIDGDTATKWCARKEDVVDKTYALNRVAQWVCVDLGEMKNFSTYTIHNTRSKEWYGNMNEWEILISDDGVNFRSVDYQTSGADAIASYNIGNQRARYVMMKIFAPDDGAGTLRLYEWSLY